MRKRTSRDERSDALDAEWSILRRSGRFRFIWLHGLLKGGLPLAVALTAFAFWYLGYSVRDLLTVRGLAVTYLIAMLAFGAMYFSASVEWSEREANHRNATKRDSE